MSTLTAFDADPRETIPPVRLPVFLVRLHLAARSIEIRVRARDRDDAIEQVCRERRGWAVGVVLRYTAGRWSPA